ncbi:hypothetical protein [Salimicrobium album]|uniref:AP2 domain-containing protein n=1 Tax=Salimicrobium album TaxID=50717 RepID=A0A1H3DDT4_9BACI|nr:hypothetical protein [Salimicrobium album]SDX64585.1 hypothetical protein SAMN04488081_0928 [Salimicrobium album]
MNLTQLEKKLDEHYQKISTSISEYAKSIEARLTEQVQTNKQLQKKLDKSEAKRQEAEVKAKDADKWEKKYYRLKETGGSGKTERKIRTVTRYTAYVVFNGRPMEVGTYDNKEDAYAAEKRAAKELAKN